MQKCAPSQTCSADSVIKTCLEHGVRHFCCAPGSRSTPLILALVRYKQAHSYIHFDERGLAFFALGLSMKSGGLVAVITTSGSAVGNLLPAIMEADNSHVPLVVITADRPFELVECGANQATKQAQIFAPFMRKSLQLPENSFDQKGVQVQLAHALQTALYPCPGPVHINCPFREPFDLPPTPLSPSCLYTTPELAVPEEAIKRWCKPLSIAERGVIVAGRGSGPCLDEMEALAKELQWPIVTDPLSPARCRSPHQVCHVHAAVLSQADAVIHIGDRLVSKAIEQVKAPFYGHITQYPTLHDPAGKVTHRLQGDVRALLQEIKNRIIASSHSDWLASCIQRSERAQSQVDAFFVAYKEISGPGLMHFLAGEIPSSLRLFVSNSMPIRDADTVFYPEKPLRGLFANRGVSGIDGNIATAAACAEIAVFGDLAFLHDLSSLSLVTQRKAPLVMVVINNGGGGIFSFLPSAKQAPEFFESHFAAAHSYTFENVAKQFRIAYHAPRSKGELEGVLSLLLHEPKTVLIEVKTDREENYLLHQSLSAFFS